MVEFVFQYRKMTTIKRITLDLHGMWNQSHKSKRTRVIRKREQEKDGIQEKNGCHSLLLSLYVSRGQLIRNKKTN